MHTRRILSHITVAFLFATLVGVQVTRAYPIREGPLSPDQTIRNLEGRDDSPNRI
ncbi:hypothetical protein H0H93_005449, partial [Arthromyces matolae]